VSKFLARREAGFTLLEVIVVMALIAIVSAVTVLSMAFYIPNVRLKSVAQDLDIQIQRARLEAIRRSRPVAIRFFTSDLTGTQKYGPIVWIDENYDPGNIAHPLLETGEEVLFRMSVNEVGADIWEMVATKGVRFNSDKDGDGLTDADSDGVTFTDNNFVLNSRGISNKSGSIHLVNTRDKTKEIMVTLGGAVRIF
jgi:prepilin-type N-terminal cleavage/methylation domain-containing protein